MDAVELAAGDGQVGGLLRHQMAMITASWRAASSLTSSSIRPGRCSEGDALGLHLRDAPADVVLLHLEIGDAEGERPPGRA